MKKKTDWGLLQGQAGQHLSAEDAQILGMLAEGKSTPQIRAPKASCSTILGSTSIRPQTLDEGLP